MVAQPVKRRNGDATRPQAAGPHPAARPESTRVPERSWRCAETSQQSADRGTSCPGKRRLRSSLRKASAGSANRRWRQQRRAASAESGSTRATAHWQRPISAYPPSGPVPVSRVEGTDRHVATRDSGNAAAPCARSGASRKNDSTTREHTPTAGAMKPQCRCDRRVLRALCSVVTPSSTASRPRVARLARGGLACLPRPSNHGTSRRDTQSRGGLISPLKHADTSLRLHNAYAGRLMMRTTAAAHCKSGPSGLVPLSRSSRSPHRRRSQWQPSRSSGSMPARCAHWRSASRQPWSGWCSTELHPPVGAGLVTRSRPRRCSPSPSCSASAGI